MTRLQSGLAAAIGLLGLLGLVLPLSAQTGLTDTPFLTIFALLCVVSLVRFRFPLPVLVDGCLTLAAGIALLMALTVIDRGGAGYWCLAVAGWLSAWLFVERLTASGRGGRWTALAVPVLFGVTLLVLWEVITRGLNVPMVLLPPPSAIGARFAASIPILWADFQQTFLKAVLIGYALGCGSAFLVAIAIDRSPFLQRGLLPVGNLISALPIIGIAPIMVMWFGFDWPSKAAVVIVMTFFPMLVNTVAGLAEAGRMERDLMRTYAAGYWQTLVKLRLPAAAPFIFNALKINSTLALIGAIVAEFFGTPIVGMGFRISTEVGRMNVDMVWAEIAVAAVAGSAFFGAVALVERAVTFWHPSNRA
ncbi:ABC transporter permease [Thalassobaculum sp. OXR-137]|uniref:ABC transporter permease n=1 Tax=Thalassobaculum sp. OXR-137 TaxID=3100173 RepID=UPI002AC9BAC6|nr:ABC transporter permease [Thalassobaculum sp. OXR-137]WPZ32925.1 ABC transporter permease [Thalassobaculum sp. OXR-137]